MTRKIPNRDLAAMPPMTIKGNNQTTGEEPVDLTVAEVIAMGIGGGGGGVTDGDYGDIIVSGGATVWTIDNDVVSDAKLRNSSGLSVIGRSANSTGDPADISAGVDGYVLRRSGTTLGFGTVATAGIGDDQVTDAKLRNAGALSVIGRSANSSGDPADIATTAASDAVLRESGGVLGFGTVATGGVANDAITDAKFRNSAALSVIGRSANSTGDPADIAAGSDGDVLRRSGTSLGFGAIPESSVTSLVGDLDALRAFAWFMGGT